VLISRALLDELIAHASEEAPNECCGIVAVEAAAADGHARAARVHRAVNTAASPLRFEVDGRELLHAIDEIERAGRELGAIYHSHTRSAPYPSQTDINFAVNWPGVEWIIVGLGRGEQPEVRSYLIDGAHVQEVAMQEDAP
jgi:proteasome lid subunit RPN8/RPN11